MLMSKDFAITHVGKTKLSLPLSFKFIEAGGKQFTFQEDDGTGEQSFYSQEVILTQSFWLCAYPTTQEFWDAVLDNDESGDVYPFASKFNGNHRPVDNASWILTVEFITALNTLNFSNKLKFDVPNSFSGTFSLPSEVEWEYAAKANNNYIYSGSNNLQDVGWYKANNLRVTMPVGLKEPNAFGLYDMSGNIKEWCLDRFENSNTEKAIRGGSFDDDSIYCKVKTRVWGILEAVGIGFRLKFVSEDGF